MAPDKGRKVANPMVSIDAKWDRIVLQRPIHLPTRWREDGSPIKSPTMWDELYSPVFNDMLFNPMARNILYTPLWQYLEKGLP